MEKMMSVYLHSRETESELKNTYIYINNEVTNENISSQLLGLVGNCWLPQSWMLQYGRPANKLNDVPCADSCDGARAPMLSGVDSFTTYL